MNLSCTCRAARPLLSARRRPSASSFRAFSSPSSSSSPSSKPSPSATIPVSSCPAGTRITGLNFKKDGVDPIAMEDSEYPAWLWMVHLPKVAKPRGEETEQETLRRERKELRKEGRAAIKASNSLKKR